LLGARFTSLKVLKTHKSRIHDPQGRNLMGEIWIPHSGLPFVVIHWYVYV